jgi:hypothetical protein
LPAGDAHRVWFPEMLAALRSQWNPGMSLAGLIELRTSVDGILRQIRHERHILPPVIRCRRCGRTGQAAEPKVSVRATILALARFDIASPTVTKKMEKEWAKYRVQNGLDLYGQAAAPATEVLDCTHTTQKE